MTFGAEAQTDAIDLETGYQDDAVFRIRIYDPHLFADRESLKQIVHRWRQRFPFLTKWRLHSAQHGYGNSILYFRNMSNAGIDEFSEAYLVYENESFQERALPDDTNELFSLEQGLHPVAGGYTGGHIHAISPVRDCYISEFSLQYLALFLLSSLMRYRPQTWTHAISGSVIPGETADDRALSLIERFLDLNRSQIPGVVVRVLNPYEDNLFA
jgi:hypothetical protein